VSLIDDLRLSITADEFSKLNFEKIDKFNFDLLGEMSECLHDDENIIDTLNRLKFIIDPKSDIDISIVIMNLCFLVVTEVLEKMKDRNPDAILNKCSVFKAILAYHQMAKK